MAGEDGRIDHTQLADAFDAESVVDHFAHGTGSDEMVLGGDVVFHKRQTLLVGFDALVLRRQDAFSQALGQDGPLGDFVHPFDAFGEDFGIGAVAEVPRIDAWMFGRIGAGDVDCPTGQWMFETNEKGDSILAFGTAVRFG